MSERYRGGEYYRTPETPEQQLRTLARREADFILYESSDPLAREIAEKILMKTKIKDRVDSLYRYQDDVTTYQELKKLDLVVVRHALSTWSVSDPKSGFVLQEGDEYMDLHIPPIHDRSGLARRINSSLQMTAQYIDYQKLQPKYVLGATYGQLARIAPKFGFHTLEVELPEDIRRGVENVYSKFTERGQAMEPIDGLYVCYQTSEEFIDRFIGK